MAGKRTYKILLSDEDKKILHATIHNKKTCKMTIRRCQILLELDENAPKHLTQMQIAKTFGVSKATVSNIVSAYVNGGIPAAWEKIRNQECAKVIWHFTAPKARNKLISLYPKFESTGE